MAKKLLKFSFWAEKILFKELVGIAECADALC